MNKLIVTAFLSLAFVACGGGREPVNPLAKAQPGDSQEVLDAKKLAQNRGDTEAAKNFPESPSTSFEPTKSFLGRLLTLNIPSETNYGSITLHGDSAQKLFESMKIKATEVPQNDPVWGNAKVKKGFAMNCYAQAAKSAPQTLQYSCLIAIDYRAGSIEALKADQKIEQDETVADLKENFSNPDIILVASESSNKWSQITLSGLDALALYKVLAMEPTPVKVGDILTNKKQGTDMSCTEIMNEGAPQPAYECSVFMDYRLGSVSALADGRTR